MDPIPYAETFNFRFFALSMLTTIFNHSEASWICCIWKSDSIFCFLGSSASCTRVNFEISIDFKFKFSLNWLISDCRLKSPRLRWRVWLDLSLYKKIEFSPWRVFLGVRCDYLRYRGQEFSSFLRFHWMRWIRG